MVDESQVRHIADLARLRLDDDEVARYAVQLRQIVEYMDKLKALNVGGIEPTAHPLPVRDVFGDDVPAESYDAPTAMRNAPDRRNGFFAMPKVLDTGGRA